MYDHKLHSKILKIFSDHHLKRTSEIIFFIPGSSQIFQPFRLYTMNCMEITQRVKHNLKA